MRRSLCGAAFRRFGAAFRGSALLEKSSEMPRTGRPPGSKDRGQRQTAAVKQARRAAASGEVMPLDVMLFAMRAGWKAAQAEDLPETRRFDLLRDVQQFARDAAPYCHAKLASVTHKGDEAAPLAFVIYGEREAENTEAWAAEHARDGSGR